MRIGRLDTLVTRRVSTTTWAEAEATEAWADGVQFYADVQEQTGREALRAGQVDARQGVVVTARYADSASVTPRDRLALPDGRVLDVESAREIGRREGREFLCLLNTDGGA